MNKKILCGIFLFPLLGCGDNVSQKYPAVKAEMIKIRDYLNQPAESTTFRYYPKKTSVTVGMKVKTKYLSGKLPLFPLLSEEFGYEKKFILGDVNGHIYCHKVVPGKYLLFDNWSLFAVVSGKEKDKKMCPGNLNKSEKSSKISKLRTNTLNPHLPHVATCSIPDDYLLKTRRGYFIARDILPELIAYVHQRDALRIQATAQEETTCK